MTEDEWDELGSEIMLEWCDANRNNPPTSMELDAFGYAWEMAWQNREKLHD